MGSVLSFRDVTDLVRQQEALKLAAKVFEASHDAIVIAEASGKIVAVKKIPIDAEMKELMVEIDMMKDLASEYVVQYFGCWMKEPDIWVRACPRPPHRSRRRRLSTGTIRSRGPSPRSSGGDDGRTRRPAMSQCDHIELSTDDLSPGALPARYP